MKSGGFVAVVFLTIAALASEISRGAERRAETKTPDAASTAVALVSLKVSVSRWGACLKLQLADGTGRPLRANRGADPPQFTVYHGDRVVGAGTFEYG